MDEKIILLNKEEYDDLIRIEIKYLQLFRAIYYYGNPITIAEATRLLEIIDGELYAEIWGNSKCECIKN